MMFGGAARSLAGVAEAKTRRRLAWAGVILAALVLGVGVLPSGAEDLEITHRRETERKSFTDAEIIDGFFKVTFGAEFHIAGRVDRIRKYAGPVRVYVDNRTKPDRTAQIGTVIADIGKRIRNLDIATTTDRDDSRVMVSLVGDRDLARSIRTLYGVDRARRIQRSLEPQCLSGFRKDERSQILHSDVLIVADAGDFIFYDCAYEELLQALGPINDDRTVPWTMFNDDVQMGFFDLYDQYLLNILYDKRVQPGMTKSEVRNLLPQVLPDVRAWVDHNNKPSDTKP